METSPTENTIAQIFKLIGCIVIGWMFWTCNRSSDDSPAKHRSAAPSYKADAFTTAQLYVAGKLKSPSSAHFCSVNDADISQYAGKTVVTGWVESENSFGAHPRSTWTCALSGSPGSYTVTEFMWK